MYKNCTLTTACFDLTKYHSGCRSVSDSINYFTPLLKIECYLVIYTDHILIDTIKEARKEFDEITKYIVLNFEDIESYKYIDIVKKNREDYWPTKDARTCSEAHLLQCNKFNFILQTMELNPFDTPMFGWIDSNLGVNFTKICKDFKNEYLLNLLNINDNKFHIQVLNVADKNYKMNKKDYYNKYQWVVCGCLFITEKTVGIKILNRLNEIFVETTLMGYGHGEEMLFLEVLDEFYDDIEKSYGDYGQIINNFITTTENLHYIFYLIIRKYIQFKYYKECYHCCKKMIYSIDNNKIECCEKIHLFILISYYISASSLEDPTILNLSSAEEHQEYIKNIVDKIYKICNEDRNIANEFYNNREYYLNTFSFF
jgi:hypothetical protein